MEYIQSFQRYETKYLLTEKQAAQLLDAAGDMLLRDKYGDYTICNIYLDTDDFFFIQHSLDKPVYKEKLRVRSYGNVSGDDTVFFEIKKKFRGVVYKRRITIPCNEAERYLRYGEKPPSVQGFRAEQIFSEISYLMERYTPVPKLYLAYDRSAYRSEEFPQLRVTFDSNIRGRWDELTLESDADTSLLDTGITDYRLMEIKSDGAIPIKLTKLLSELKIYPTSFSKYGNIYRAHLHERKEQII